MPRHEKLGLSFLHSDEDFPGTDGKAKTMPLKVNLPKSVNNKKQRTVKKVVAMNRF